MRRRSKARRREGIFLQPLRLRVAGALTDSAPPEDVRRIQYDDLEASLRADYRANGHDLANLPHKLPPLRRTFGAYRAVQITTATMRAYADARLEQTAAPATVNSELGLLRRMLNLGHEDGRLLHVPAVPKLRDGHPSRQSHGRSHAAPRVARCAPHRSPVAAAQVLGLVIADVEGPCADLGDAG